MGAEAKNKRKSNEQEETQVIYHEELPTEIWDYMFRAGKYLFRRDVNVLMRMDEYGSSFLKFQREIVADLQNEKKEWEAERENSKSVCNG